MIEEYKKLGFSSREEEDLYHDVCGGYMVLVSPEDGRAFWGKDKGSFDWFIEKNALLSLFVEVKEMPMLERMVRLYQHYASKYLFSGSLLNESEKKYSEAQSLFDGENMCRWSNVKTRIEQSKMQALNAINHIRNVAPRRLGGLLPEFESRIADIPDVLDSDPQK